MELSVLPLRTIPRASDRLVINASAHCLVPLFAIHASRIQEGLTTISCWTNILVVDSCFSSRSATSIASNDPYQCE